MNISVAKRDLLRLVGRCQGVVDKKSTMPVLANVLINVESPSSVRIAATDLYLAISGHAPAEVVKGGSTAIPAKDFFERIKMMPEGPIQISVGDSGATEIRSGVSPRRYHLHGLPGDSFPALPEPDKDTPPLDLEVDSLATLINTTAFSISSDETRPHLNSALFEWDNDRVRMITTDGHRLTKAEISVPDRHAARTMLIPLKAIAELRRLADEAKTESPRDGQPAMVQIAQSGPNAFFSFGETRFCVKLVDAQFPAYQQVIPHASDRIVRTSRVTFIEALKAVSLAASDRTGGVKLSLEGSSMRISSESPESGDGFDEVPVDYTGPNLTIGFNAKYLLDAMGVLGDDEVSLVLSGELDPAVVRPADETEDRNFIAVVMPMRI